MLGFISLRIGIWSLGSWVWAFGSCYVEFPDQYNFFTLPDEKSSNMNHWRAAIAGDWRGISRCTRIMREIANRRSQRSFRWERPSNHSPIEESRCEFPKTLNSLRNASNPTETMLSARETHTAPRITVKALIGSDGVRRKLMKNEKSIWTLLAVRSILDPFGSLVLSNQSRERI